MIAYSLRAIKLFAVRTRIITACVGLCAVTFNRLHTMVQGSSKSKEVCIEENLFLDRRIIPCDMHTAPATKATIRKGHGMMIKMSVDGMSSHEVLRIRRPVREDALASSRTVSSRVCQPDCRAKRVGSMDAMQ